MLDKIKFGFLVLIAYLLGGRAYTVYAKWKPFNNKIVPYDSILLRKGTDIYSSDAMAQAIDQVGLVEIFRKDYVFDHLEPTTMLDYFTSKTII